MRVIVEQFGSVIAYLEILSSDLSLALIQLEILVHAVGPVSIKSTRT